MEPKRKVLQPSKQPPPPPEELPKPEGIQVICNARVLEVYKSRGRRTTDLWQNMLILTEQIAEEQNWCDSKGARSLVYHLAQKYAESKDQNEKDVIVLYFMSVAECYAGELVGGDDDDAEQEAIDFVNECLVDEGK